MKEHYLNQIALLQRQIALAKVGYLNSMNRLADKLKAAQEEEIGEIVKELTLEHDAFNSLKLQLDYNQEEYRKECARGGK